MREQKKSARIASILSLRERDTADRIAVPRHRHDEITIRFAVLLYAYVGVSSRQVPKILQLAGMLWNGIDGKLPSHVSVLDWVEKCGLSILQGSLKDKTAEQANYSLIIDNSITVCGQDLHLELLASSEHPGHAITHADVSVAQMQVGRKWNKKATKAQLGKTIAEMELKPDYVVSDNGDTMCYACEDLGIDNHRDISHSFGMFLERVYAKDTEFQEFITKKGYARKFSHTTMAPLMPPKRREYARFMNVFETVRWAKGVLQNEHLLSCHEKWMLGFVRHHASLVEELAEVMQAYEYMERLCKQKGLSHETASECRRHIHAHLMARGDRVRKLADMLIGYFNREESLLKDGETHNICSDIIESAFGYLKERMSPNKNNGYTSLTLLLPLHLEVSVMNACRTFHVRELMEKSTLTDVKNWRSDKLLPNPSIKRMKVVKNVA